MIPKGFVVTRSSLSAHERAQWDAQYASRQGGNVVLGAYSAGGIKPSMDYGASLRGGSAKGIDAQGKIILYSTLKEMLEAHTSRVALELIANGQAEIKLGTSAGNIDVRRALREYEGGVLEKVRNSKVKATAVRAELTDAETLTVRLTLIRPPR